MGKVFAIDGLTIDSDNPKVLLDDILTEGPGSLVLVDPSHAVSKETLALTTPVTHGLAIPNLAMEQAAATVGAGDMTTLSPGMTVSTNAATARMERSAKGGIYGVVSQVNDSSGNRASLGFPTLLRSYVEANPTHDYFIGLWGLMLRNARNTTAGGLTGYPLAGFKSAGSTSEKEWATIRQFRVGSGTVGVSPTGVELMGNRNASPPVSNFIVNLAVNTRVSTWAAESLESRLAQWGPYGASYVHDSPSWVLHRLYIEDLTVSGRNYFTVDALSAGLFARHVSTPGGRLNGDTVTTLPVDFP